MSRTKEEDTKVPAANKTHSSAIPGFGLSFGFAMTYLSLIVLIPLSSVFFKSSSLGWSHFWASATAPRVIASYRLTIGASLAAAAINSIAGLLVAWVLARYEFPGRRFVDAIVDLPFALPTAVAGIALSSLYVETAGWAAIFSRTELKSPSNLWELFWRWPLSVFLLWCGACNRFWKIWTKGSRKRQPASARIPGRHFIASFFPPSFPPC
ncbi:MAG: hypothetical protein PVS2B2_27790 [Candidatus Acidiferrum sp.]